MSGELCMCYGWLSELNGHPLTTFDDEHHDLRSKRGRAFSLSSHSHLSEAFGFFPPLSLYIPMFPSHSDTLLPSRTGWDSTEHE